jgi:universal stress protein A
MNRIMKTKRLGNSRPGGLKRCSTRKVNCSVRAGSRGSVVSSLKLKRIVVPTDFSQPALKAIKYAAQFAGSSGGTIYLLNVIERAVLSNDFQAFPLVLPERELGKICKEALLSLAATEIEELIPVEVAIRAGKPYLEIVNFARETDADLIVMATHGRSGLKHVLLGSTAELVIRHASCPVFVVRDREHEFI